MTATILEHSGSANDRLTNYHEDFYAWTREQVLRLQAGDYKMLDRDNLIEELIGMAKNEERALVSDLGRIIEHLLKLDYGLDKAPRRRWRISVEEHRDRVRDLLTDSPSLATYWSEALNKAWRRGSRAARSGLTEDEAAAMPDHLSYSLEQLLENGYFGERDAAA